MKKLVFTFVLCFAVGLSFGQKKAVNTVKNEIKATKPNVEEARATIQGALKNPETMNDAETWYVAGKLEDRILDSERMKEVLGQTPDDDVMYPALFNIYPYFLKASELDQLPDEKGKVKPRFIKDIRATMKANRPYYINAGNYFYEKGDYRKAYENWRFYGDMPKLPIFEAGDKDFKALENDTNIIQIRYYAAIAATAIPDLDAAIELFNEIKNLGWNENTIHQILADLYTQQEDTANYVNTLEQGVVKFPEESYFLFNLINIMIGQGKNEEAINYLQRAITANPDDPQLYNALGIVYRNLNQIENASESLQKALAIKPDHANSLSHMGLLYYNMGVVARGEADNIVDNKLYSEALKKVNDLFKQAIPYLEKAYELDPTDNDAVFALRNIYYILGNNSQYEKWDRIFTGGN